MGADNPVRGPPQFGIAAAISFVLILSFILGACAAERVGPRVAPSGEESPYDPPSKIPSVGITFDAPGSIVPGIDATTAIARARDEFGGLVDEASEVYTAFGLFTSSKYGTVASEDGSVTQYVSVPAWIVTLAGVSIPPSGPRREGAKEGRMGTATELNVVVNADTGNYMMAFSYR